MVRIQRFVLLLLLTCSVGVSGCANTRSRFASLWRRGADDSFSESIVDNRDLPKSAREMADNVQDSLRDSGDDLDRLADSARNKSPGLDESQKRYTESSADERLDELDNRINDVVSRAKSRTATKHPKTRSDFPEDPFLNEFNDLADKSNTTLDEDSDPVLARLASAKQKLAASRDPFGDEREVAERLITTVNNEQPVNDTLGEINPFESLPATTPVQSTGITNDSVDTGVEQFELVTEQPPASTKNAVVSTTEETVDTLADEFPDLDFPTTNDTELDTSTAKIVAKINDSDEFDLLFTEAKSVAVQPTERTFQENRFQPASAQLRESDSISDIFGDTDNSPQEKVAESRDVRDDFDRMIVDSDELPQRTNPQPRPVSKLTRDEFTGANQKPDTYDDFFETDNSVRANEPGDATQRDTNPFSFAEPVSKPVSEPKIKPSINPRSTDQPESDLALPFEEFDDSKADIPVASTKSRSSFDVESEQSTAPFSLVAQPSTSARPPVVRVSGNTATANRSHELQAVDGDLTPFQQQNSQPGLEVTTTSSDLGPTRPVELPQIVPGDTASSTFNDEPFVDLSAVTQTPLENVAWEVEPDTSIRLDGTSRTSPWFAWIAVALCSLALILLLRPATNRIS